MYKFRFIILSLIKLVRLDFVLKRLRFIKRGFILILDDLIVRVANNKSKNKQGVLLVRLDAIGDFVIWLNTANEYKSNFPEHKITLVGNLQWEELAKNMPYWDEVIGIDVLKFKSNLIYRWRILINISNRGFLIAIQPNSSRSLLLGDSIIKSSLSDFKIGSEGDLNNIYSFEKVISDKWYTRLIKNIGIDKSEIERNSEFVSLLFNKKLRPGLPHIDRIITDDTITISNSYFVVAPGASWIGRQWPADSFAEVVGFISNKYNLQPVFCGSKSERFLCDSIIMQSETKAINLAGLTTLSQLVELLRGAKFVLANESSSIHISNAVETVAFCLTGGGHYGRFVPYINHPEKIVPIVINEQMECYNCNWKCKLVYDPEGPVPCIKNISVLKVINEISVFLK